MVLLKETGLLNVKSLMKFDGLFVNSLVSHNRNFVVTREMEGPVILGSIKIHTLN